MELGLSPGMVKFLVNHLMCQGLVGNSSYLYNDEVPHFIHSQIAATKLVS